MSAIVGSCVDSRRNAPASFDVANSSSTIGIIATAFKRTNRLIILDLQIGHLMLGTAADAPGLTLLRTPLSYFRKTALGSIGGCGDIDVKCRSPAALSSM
jgi:hypothetical protein